MDDLERDQFVVLGVTAGDEEERRVSAVDNLGVYGGGNVSAGMPGELVPGRIKGASQKGRAARTFVLEEVAHPSPPSQDQLGDVLDDLGLLLGRERREPFCEALRAGQ